MNGEASKGLKSSLIDTPSNRRWHTVLPGFTVLKLARDLKTFFYTNFKGGGGMHNLGKMCAPSIILVGGNRIWALP